MARLKVRRNQQDYGEVNLNESQSYFIGRKENCDLVLQSDPGISRQHIEIKYKSGIWTAHILSRHLPILHNGKTLNQLELTTSPMEFQVPPYDFTFENDAVDENSAASHNPESFFPDSHAPESNDIQNNFAAINQAVSDGQELIKEDVEESIQPEVTFHGNEENTNEIDLSGEPYLKFVYSTHSESIRLKGNKWVAGRDSITQIHLDDRKASRMHFSIEKVGDQYFIKDLQSANGTMINGQDLIAHEATEIKSGDIITVNQLTIIFEIRDLSFSEKLKDLPLQAYSGPMILTSQDWDAVGANALPNAPQSPLSAPQLAKLSNTAHRISNSGPKNPIRLALMGIVALMIVIGVFYSDDSSQQKASGQEDIKTFESLSSEDQKVVIDDYNLVQQYAANGQIENAISRIDKIHTLVPFYKDSKEIEARMREAREIVKQQEFIKQQQREQAETKARVASIVADCRDRYITGVDANAARSCLAEALQLDPDNIDAQSIINGIELRLSQAQEQERILKEYNDNVEKGRELFTKAKNHLQSKDYHEAINAFSAHVNSNLPDPDELKAASLRTIASVQNHINAQKSIYMNKARAQIQAGNLRDAILNAEQAKKVDPYDYTILNFIESHRRDLEGQMKLLYQESAIEERFGNLTKSEEKWKMIIEKDIPSGEYYQKAKRKIQQFGRY